MKPTPTPATAVRTVPVVRLIDDLHSPLVGLCGLLRLLSTATFHWTPEYMQAAALHQVADLAQELLNTLDAFVRDDETD
jgi:hypothetical protein